MIFILKFLQAAQEKAKKAASAWKQEAIRVEQLQRREVRLWEEVRCFMTRKTLLLYDVEAGSVASGGLRVEQARITDKTLDWLQHSERHINFLLSPLAAAAPGSQHPTAKKLD